jgi:hypothetical protein
VHLSKELAGPAVWLINSRLLFALSGVVFLGSVLFDHAATESGRSWIESDALTARHTGPSGVLACVNAGQRGAEEAKLSGQRPVAGGRSVRDVGFVGGASLAQDVQGVELDSRRFSLIYLTLDFKSRMRLATTALLGRRAHDPETAWLVCMLALQQLRLRWLRLATGIFFVAGSVLVFALTHRFTTVFVLPWFFVGLVLLVSIWTHSRAVRVNEPIARQPGTR